MEDLYCLGDISEYYTTEITKALIKYLFEIEKVERIEALVGSGNEASKRVLEKSGFIQEGLLRSFAYINNKFVNVYYYGIIKDDYFDLGINYSVS
ncbi:GNAT family N-acetyltransferase [Clostridium gasigenes]|uniref:GNAT family N-acetyltransferase n=1 Tax=Clostridium gasigenes TaxID=94869 RepID=UPI001C0CF0B3|nr:GNAT family protein [Clostridium gasigenes]MBU3137642.1 GNAT family N-acetyltransferase [Clostridium gasigenes]